MAPPGIGKVPMTSGAIARAIRGEGAIRVTAPTKASIAPDFFMAEEKAIVVAGKGWNPGR